MTEWRKRQLSCLITRDEDPELIDIDWRTVCGWMPKLRAAMFLVADSVIDQVEKEVLNHSDVDICDWSVKFFVLDYLQGTPL